MKTIKIHGNDYVTVNERIMFFREHYSKWSIETEIIYCDEKRCLVKAVVRDESGRIMATGTAQEIAGSNYINKSSHVENAETSAWGRALGCLGIGIEGGIASADEVINATNHSTEALKLKEMPEDVKIKFKELKLSVGQVKDFCAKQDYDWDKIKQLLNEKIDVIDVIDKVN